MGNKVEEVAHKEKKKITKFDIGNENKSWTSWAIYWGVHFQILQVNDHFGNLLKEEEWEILPQSKIKTDLRCHIRYGASNQSS